LRRKEEEERKGEEEENQLPLNLFLDPPRSDVASPPVKSAICGTNIRSSSIHLIACIPIPAMRILTHTHTSYCYRTLEFRFV